MKIKIMTHISDSDGIFPVVIAKQVFDVVDYELLTPEEVDEALRNTLPLLDQYDHIYITDLNISRELAEMIQKNETYRSKITIIDHHIGKIDMNDFSFITVIATNSNGIKQCATSLFYQHLLPQYPVLDTPCFHTLVEDVRALDTWDFQDHEESKNIGLLFDLYGKEYFMNYLDQYVKTHKTFAYEEKELILFSIENKKIESYIEKMKENVQILEIDGQKAGFIFCDRYISEVGHALSVAYQDQIDYIILAKLSKGRVSYRADKSEISVIPIAQKHGGNGHQHAAANSIPDEIQKQIALLLYPEAIWKGVIHER